MKSIQVQKPSFLNNLAKSTITWFKDWQNLIIILLVLLAFLLHLGLIPSAHGPTWDEYHYIPEARSIINQGEITNPEHPALGKLFIAGGISVFGDNPWGWRVPSAIFATASILIFYCICRQLTVKTTAILATILFSFESLAFFFSGIAMLDIFSLTFMLLAFLFYLHNRYVFSGATLALSGLCKMTGLLGVFVILVHWVLTRRSESPRTITYFLASAVIAFMLLMPLFDFAATREWTSPLERLGDMLVYHKGLTSDDVIWVGETSSPWEWIMNPQGGNMWLNPNIIMIINPALWVLIVPSMGYMIYEFIKHRTSSSLFIILWFAATYLFWIPIVIATDRVTYVHYFVPIVGALCIAIAIMLTRLWVIQSKAYFVNNHPVINLLIRRLFQVGIVGYLIIYALFFMYFWVMAYS